MRKSILTALFCLTFALPIAAVQTLSKDARFSLLTCSPGELVYELFGHSALRIQDDSLGLDLVFNYGVFSFYTENFILKFVSGQTDYTIGLSRYNDFCIEYAARGSSVKESFLNFSQNEKQALWEYLNWNLLPQNRIYRYNFIFNNCATKIRDAIEESADSRISYHRLKEEPLTFRQAIAFYTTTAEWSKFGFDICLGAGTDRKATTRELMFLPEFMDEAFCNAEIGHGKPLINEHTEIVKATAEHKAALLSPIIVCWILFGIILALSSFEYIGNIKLGWLDIILFSINSIAGLIILYLMFFSEHPFTTANFNALWLNPLFLISLFVGERHSTFGFVFCTATATIILLTILLSPVIPQVFNAAFYPLMLIFMTRLACKAVKIYKL